MNCHTGGTRRYKLDGRRMGARLRVWMREIVKVLTRYVQNHN